MMLGHRDEVRWSQRGLLRLPLTITSPAHIVNASYYFLYLFGTLRSLHAQCQHVAPPSGEARWNSTRIPEIHAITPHDR